MMMMNDDDDGLLVVVHIAYIPGVANLNGANAVFFVVVEFYLYPPVSTALIHSVKPELTPSRTISNSVNVQTKI